MLIIPVIGLCALLAVHIASPWQFLHDDNGAWFSATARTHIIRGLSQTKGQDFFLVRETGELRPYLHHPPFISLYLAGVFEATGLDTPLVARTAVAVLHVLSFLLFLQIGRLLLGDRLLARAWSACIFAIVPMSAFFGKMPNHEVPALLFLELGVLASLYVSACGECRRRHWIALFLAWFLVPFASWHATLAGLVFVLCFACVIPRPARLTYLLAAGSGLMAALLVVLVQLLWANHWHSIPSQHTSFFHWLTAPEGENRLAFWAQSIEHATKHGRRFFADIPWVLSIVWVLWTGVRRFRGIRPTSTELAVMFLGAGSVLYCLLFARAVRIHAYQQFYLIPFVALSSALCISELYGRLSRHRKSLAVLLLVLSGSVTMYSAGSRLYKLYGTPSSYALDTSKAIEAQFY